MEEKTLAMELLTDLKQTNKRQFITIIILVLSQLFTIGIFIWYINQFDYYTETIQEMTDIDNSTTNQRINE